MKDCPSLFFHENLCGKGEKWFVCLVEKRTRNTVVGEGEEKEEEEEEEEEEEGNT